MKLVSVVVATYKREIELKKALESLAGQTYPYMEIVLVDGYVDVGTLNILSKKKENVAVTVYTQQRTKLSQTDVDNFNAQYPKLDVKYTRAFHDRFLILDKTKAYHVGASLKDAGKKCFGINLIEDAGIVRDILQRLELETEE